jgi:hypothetical protein
VISFSVTFTSPGQRQQLVQRWQRYLGGVFMLLYFKEAVLCLKFVTDETLGRVCSD